MALKDTLQRAADRAAQQSQFEREKPEIIREWQQAVVEVEQKISIWLEPYTSNGYLNINVNHFQYEEELLGKYVAQVLFIKASHATVEVRPVGRMLLGATGRLDMFRQGRASEGQTVRIIRYREREREAWFLRAMETVRQGPAIMARPSEPVPFEQQSFENALDELLQ